MKYYFGLLVCLLGFWPGGVGAQTPLINQLRGQLRQATTDTARARLWRLLAYEASTPDSTIFFSNRGLAVLGQALPKMPPTARPRLLLQRAEVLYNVAEMYVMKGQFDSAIACQKRQLTACQLAGNPAAIAGAVLVTADIYMRKQDTPGTLAAFQRGQRVIDELPPGQAQRQGKARLMILMGTYYANQRDVVAARQYYATALQLLEKEGAKAEIARLLTSLTNIELETPSLLSQAEAHAHRAMQLARELHSAPQEALANYSLGSVLATQGHVPEARAAYLTALQLPGGELLDRIKGLILIQLAKIEIRLHHLDAAQRYATQAQQMATESHTNLPAYLHEVQAAIAHAQGRDSTALRYYKAFIAARDSASNETTRRAALTQRLTYESQLREN